jgi:hypothetical protein
MKFIIKNDNRDIVKNPNVKIIETTKDSFTDQIVFVEENDITIIKYTDTGSIYFVKDLDNLYDRKSKSEVLLNITTDELQIINTDSRPYKVYTALLTQTVTNAPVATVLENTLGNIVWSYSSEGNYIGTLSGSFVENNTKLEIGLVTDTDYTSVYFGNFYRIDNDSVGLITLDFSQSGIDGTLNNTPIEIRVYN